MPSKCVCEREREKWVWKQLVKFAGMSVHGELYLLIIDVDEDQPTFIPDLQHGYTFAVAFPQRIQKH